MSLGKEEKRRKRSPRGRRVKTQMRCENAPWGRENEATFVRCSFAHVNFIFFERRRQFPVSISFGAHIPLMKFDFVHIRAFLSSWWGGYVVVLLCLHPKLLEG